MDKYMGPSFDSSGHPVSFSGYYCGQNYILKEHRIPFSL